MTSLLMTTFDQFRGFPRMDFRFDKGKELLARCPVAVDPCRKRRRPLSEQFQNCNITLTSVERAMSIETPGRQRLFIHRNRISVANATIPFPSLLGPLASTIYPNPKCPRPRAVSVRILPSYQAVHISHVKELGAGP